MPGGGGCKVSAPMSPPPHALGCHQRLGARPLREGISLTLLHGSCCGVGEKWTRGVLPWGAEEAQPVSQNMALHPVLGQWGAELPPNHCGR